MSDRTNKLADEMVAEFKKRGIERFVFVLSDPDSDCFVGHSNDKVWSFGAMSLYTEKLRTTAMQEEE